MKRLALVAFLLAGCGGTAESFPVVYATAKSVTAPHASSDRHPYANHPSPRVRAASRELQEIRDRCRWDEARVSTGTGVLVCAAPDDEAERRVLAKLEQASGRYSLPATDKGIIQ